MRYLPFIIISLILYTLFFYNNQEPELLTANNDSSEKIVPIDFNLSSELEEKIVLEEKPSLGAKTQSDVQTVLIKKTMLEEKELLDEQEVLKNQPQLEEKVAPEKQQLQVITSTTSVVPEKTTLAVPDETIVASKEVAIQTPSITKNSTKPLDLTTDADEKIKKEIPADNSIDSIIANESALLKGEFFQRNLLVNLPPLPVKKKKTAATKNTSKQNNVSKKQPSSATKREIEQASVSSILLQNNTSLTTKQSPNFKVKKQSEKPKRTFKKQVKSMMDVAIPGLQFAIAVSGNKPQYPAQAKADKLQGTVTARFVVNTQGKTKNSQVINSSSHKVLDNALLEFVKKERFMPALDGIEKVTSEQQLSFKYEIK